LGQSPDSIVLTDQGNESPYAPTQTTCQRSRLGQTLFDHSPWRGRTFATERSRLPTMASCAFSRRQIFAERKLARSASSPSGTTGPSYRKPSSYRHRASDATHVRDRLADG